MTALELAALAGISRVLGEPLRHGEVSNHHEDLPMPEDDEVLAEIASMREDEVLAESPSMPQGPSIPQDDVSVSEDEVSRESPSMPQGPSIPQDDVSMPEDEVSRESPSMPQGPSIPQDDVSMSEDEVSRESPSMPQGPSIPQDDISMLEDEEKSEPLAFLRGDDDAHARYYRACDEQIELLVAFLSDGRVRLIDTDGRRFAGMLETEKADLIEIGSHEWSRVFVSATPDGRTQLELQGGPHDTHVLICEALPG